MESRVRHYAGTVLTGHQPDPAGLDRVRADDAYALRCRVTYLANLPEEALDPLPTRTRLVVGARSGEPLLPTAKLAIGARVGSGPAARAFLRSVDNMPADQAALVFELEAALPEGVTASFQGESMDALFTEDIGDVRRLLAIQVSREAGGELTAALIVESLDPDRDAVQKVLEHQIILLEDAPVPGGDPLVLVIPSPFDPLGEKAFVAALTVERPAQSPGHQAAIERCLAELRAEATQARTGATDLQASDLQARTVASSLRALDLAQHHRGALVFLTGHDAPLALDLALSADPTTLAAFVQLFAATNGGALPGDLAGDDLAWTLERTAWRLLADRLDRDELSTGLRGILALHAGEAGRFPGAILAALDGSPGRDPFQAAILAENHGFLSSSDPAARVRAFDWLASRDRAPEGYDPLAPREDRRLALDRHEEQRRLAGRR